MAPTLNVEQSDIDLKEQAWDILHEEDGSCTCLLQYKYWGNPRTLRLLKDVSWGGGHGPPQTWGSWRTWVSPTATKLVAKGSSKARMVTQQ